MIVLGKKCTPQLLFCIQQACFAGRAPIDLVTSAPQKTPAMSPLIKQELKKRFPEFDDKKRITPMDEGFQSKTSPGEYLKHLDTSYESFFYQRDYDLKNFTFYLQALSAQYKSKEALEALRKIETLGLRPNDECYNHVMTAYAKNRDIEMVEKLNQEAIDKYNLPPSIYRMNAKIYNNNSEIS